MLLRIESLQSKSCVGMRAKISIIDNTTPDLFRNFMPRRNEVLHRSSGDVFSAQVFPGNFNFQQFDISRTFEKWAAVEVHQTGKIPAGMEVLVIPAGLYAVFLHKGPASEGERTFRYIFAEWIPNSEYEIDDRPHFEILGAAYKNNDPESEEEVWIPIRKR